MCSSVYKRYKNCLWRMSTDWCFLALIKYSSNDEDRLGLIVHFKKKNRFFWSKWIAKFKMTKLFSLCFILSFQFNYGISGSSIFQQTENVVSAVLDIFDSNFTLIYNDGDKDYPNGRDLIHQRNDQVCLQQLNSIMSGLNNTELWAIKSEFLILFKFLPTNSTALPDRKLYRIWCEENWLFLSNIYLLYKIMSNVYHRTY